MKDFKKVITYLLPFYKKYKVSVIASFVLYGISIILSGILTPIIYKDIINVITDGNIKEKIISVFLVLIFVKTIGFITHRLGDFFIVNFQTRGIKDIYDFSFKKVNNHSYDFFANNFSGSLVAKIRRFIKSFEMIFDSILFSFYLTSIYLIGMFIVLIRENWILGTVFFVWSVVFLLITFRLNKNKIPINLAGSVEDSKVSGRISDVISNIMNLKVFSTYKSEVKEFESVTSKDYSARRRQWDFDNLVWRVTGGLLLLFELLGMGIAIYLWYRGLLSTGTVVLVQIYIAGLSSHLWNLGRNIIRFTTSVSESVEFVQILDKVISVKDKDKNTLEDVDMKNGAVSFDNVSFTYPGGDHVFENFNLHIQAGQSVGVVGKSGSGKTTITKLLLRFYDVDSGEIRIDGQEIKSVSQDGLRHSFAYIPQETILFHRSIYKNISYGDIDATREEILKAAKDAHVDEFVQNLESKYETEVGERGVKLSGGQRQRIGIARAMLRKNSPILMLDEATSSLDSMSEKYIQESFKKLSKNRTTIVIAHRLSTIQDMDRIIVMEKGEIVEDGSHSELILKRGAYFELWNSQIGDSK